MKWQDAITKQCSSFPLMLAGSRTVAENSQTQGEREKIIAGHKQAQAELPLSLEVLAFVQRYSLKSKLRLMTQDVKIQG